MGKRITLSFLFFLTLAGAGDRLAREDFKLALRYAKEGDEVRAAYHYRAVLDRQPDHRAARRALGYIRRKGKWISGRDSRTDAAAALALTWDRDAAGRERGMLAVLALPRGERLRALVISLRNRHADIRTRAIQSLGALGDKAAVRPLVARLAIAGGNPQSVYIARTRQVVFIKDFDVEIA